VISHFCMIRKYTRYRSASSQIEFRKRVPIRLHLIFVFAKLRRDESARQVAPAEFGMRIWSARTRPRFGSARHVASRKAISYHRTPRPLPQSSIPN
jgi:hypothetical protein